MMVLGILGALIIALAIARGPTRRRSGVFIKHRTVRMRACKGRLVEFREVESEREL